MYSDEEIDMEIGLGRLCSALDPVRFVHLSDSVDALVWI